LRKAKEDERLRERKVERTEGERTFVRSLKPWVNRAVMKRRYFSIE